VVSSEEESLRQEEEGEDIWSLVLYLQPAKEHAAYFSWEAFLQVQPDNYKSSPYISEWGPGAFDAAVEAHAKPQRRSENPASIIKPNLALRALYDLGLGRSSLLFEYVAKRKTFVAIMDHVTPTGYTKSTFYGLSEQMIECGMAVKTLRTFVENSYASKSSFPGRVALASAVSIILSALEEYLGQRWTGIRSILQLQNLFERPRQILHEVLGLVKALRSARTDEEISSTMFDRCQCFEHGPEWLRSIMFEVLSRISKPLLERLDEWVGFRKPIFSGGGGSGLSFIISEPLDREDPLSNDGRFILRPQALPSFISLDEGQQIFEIGQNLKFLLTHHTGHPLTEAPLRTNESISLDWKFEWPDVEAVVEKAKRYEESLAKCVRTWTSARSETRSLVPKELVATLDNPVQRFEGDYDMDLVLSMEQLDQTPTNARQFTDSLFQQVITQGEDSHSALSGDNSFAPPVALTPILSFNALLTAQARLLNGACLRLFFRSHHVRSHLNLQRSFHLMGDGVFVTRLSSALFDPNASTTERQLGVVRSGTGMGLKLGDRESWPPASSELRLALMGILSDCYQSSPERKLHHTGTHSAGSDLPGSLSFAIRTLSKEEADQILDPTSLHALDFLRLQYTPPAPLDAVLSPSSLEKYDSIFKFLLRLIRLVFVVAHLPRPTNRSPISHFSAHARHFVNGCARYFFDTGVRQPWTAFDAYLDARESLLAADDKVDAEVDDEIYAHPPVRDLGSVDDLRREHEACLDQMLFALLLRRRQARMLSLLEEIFGAVLAFDSLCRSGAVGDGAAQQGGGDGVAGAAVADLLATFEGKVGVFLAVCRGLVGKKGYGQESEGGSEGEGGIGRLVVAVDLDGFWEEGRRHR
jgi:hypothetical protein